MDETPVMDKYHGNENELASNHLTAT